MRIDLNADLGEGMASDAGLMTLITSANICCGLHAGGWEDVATAVDRAVAAGVVIGAHPGFADREHFGRRDLALTAEQIFDLCVYQIASLVEIAASRRTAVKFLKPHGGLYHQASREEATAQAVAAAAARWQLALVGLPDSRLAASARAAGLEFIPEGFADRRYQSDGTLVPRTERDALLSDTATAARQVEWLVRDRGVRTLCVHGDTPDAVSFAHTLRAALTGHGFTFGPIA